MKQVSILFYSLIVTLLLSGCANKVMPTGGVKDILPPEILSVTPPRESINFSEKVIVITFNEYVQLKELTKQLVISPLMVPAPQILIRKKSIVIELPDSLAPNTTYSINFGNAVADNNEGNVLPGFRYVFSTGPSLDSMKVSGSIVNAETKKPEKDAIAMLYAAGVADSMFMKVVPNYFARASEDGNFTINNIRPGKYKLFALIDKNLNFIYDLKEETVGFITEPIDVKDSLKYTILVTKQPLKKQSIKSFSIEDPAKLVTVFARPLQNPSFKFLSTSPKKIIEEYSDLKDSVTLYCQPPETDSVKLVWYENEIAIDTVLYKKAIGMPMSFKAHKKTASWSSYPLNSAALKSETNPFIKWADPIVAFDTTLVSVDKDSIPYPVKIYFADTIKTKLILEGSRKEGVYRIIILPQSVTDLYGRTNDSVLVSFTVPGERTIGSIAFKLNSAGPGHYILQLVNDKDEVYRQRLTDGKLNGLFEQVDPGKYRLRIIHDDNSNGRWDGGDFQKGVQPELIEYNNEIITVRANWEVEIDWNR